MTRSTRKQRLLALLNDESAEGGDHLTIIARDDTSGVYKKDRLLVVDKLYFGDGVILERQGEDKLERDTVPLEFGEEGGDGVDLSARGLQTPTPSGDSRPVRRKG